MWFGVNFIVFKKATGKEIFVKYTEKEYCMILQHVKQHS